MEEWIKYATAEGVLRVFSSGGFFFVVVEFFGGSSGWLF